MYATFDFGVTSMHILPIFTTGQLLLHSCLHFFGLHLSPFTIAIRVGSLPSDSSASAFPPAFFSFRLFPIWRPAHLPITLIFSSNKISPR